MNNLIRWAFGALPLRGERCVVTCDGLGGFAALTATGLHHKLVFIRDRRLRKLPQLLRINTVWLVQFVLICIVLVSNSTNAGVLWSTGPASYPDGNYLNAPSVPVSALPGVDVVIFDIGIENDVLYDRVQMAIGGGGPGGFFPLIKGFAVSDGDLLPTTVKLLEAVPGVKQILVFEFETPIKKGRNPSHLAMIVPEGTVTMDRAGGYWGLRPEGETFVAWTSYSFIKLSEFDPRYTPYLAVKLTSSSKAKISQSIVIPSSDFTVSFDYAFQSRSGVLDVSLNGLSIGTLTATGESNSNFRSASFQIDGPLLAALQLPNGTLGSIDLSINGASGSEILLDNIQFPSVVNAGFDSATMFGWDSEGFVSVVAVPEPSAFLLLLSGLLGFGLFARQHRRL